MNMDEMLNELATTRQSIVDLHEQEKVLKAKKDDLGNAISSIPIFGDIISKDSIKDEYLHLHNLQ